VPTLFFVLFFSVNLLYSAEIADSFNLKAQDKPNDDGGAIELRWTLPAEIRVEDVEKIELYCKGPGDRKPVKIADLKAKQRKFTDESSSERKLKNKTLYTYYLKTILKDGSEILSSQAQGFSKIQWYDKSKTVTAIGTIISIALILYCIYKAKTDSDFFIRRMVVIDAIEEGVGRATEMGKPILYVSGLSTIADVATIAAINILGHVAKKCAEYGTRLIVPNRDSIVMTVQQEVVKEAYTAVGKPDAYREEDVFYLTDDQMAYVAAVDGIMVRERPATNFFLGMFYAESLILAETGASTGAIQIAGTDAVTQLPFFITACDYTLIGEELYAASAYMSKEPLLLGSLKGQDYLKFLLMVAIFLGAILFNLGYPFLKNWFMV